MVLYMTSKNLAKFLLDKNPGDFYYVVASDRVSVEQQYPNIAWMMELVPSPSVMRQYYNDGLTNSYQNAYIKMLTKPQSLRSILIIVNAILKGINIVLVQAPMEKNMHYMDILADYIEATFGLHVYSWKEYKADKLIPYRHYTEEQLKKAKEISDAMVKHLTDEGVETRVILNPEEYREALKQLKKKELRKICAVNRIPLYDTDDSKSKIAEKIMRRVCIF